MKFVPYNDLEPRYGIPGSSVTIWRRERAGKFPKRTPFGDRAYGWPDALIEAYIGARAAGADEETATRIAEDVRANMGGTGARRP